MAGSSSSQAPAPVATAAPVMSAAAVDGSAAAAASAMEADLQARGYQLLGEADLHRFGNGSSHKLTYNGAGDGAAAASTVASSLSESTSAD